MLFRSHQLRIRYQPSREFLAEAARRPELSHAQRDALESFLSFCDDVKFGQAPATEAQQDHVLAVADRVIRETMPSSPASPEAATR